MSRSERQHAALADFLAKRALGEVFWSVFRYEPHRRPGDNWVRVVQFNTEERAIMEAKSITARTGRCTCVEKKEVG